MHLFIYLFYFICIYIVFAAQPLKHVGCSSSPLHRVPLLLSEFVLFILMDSLFPSFAERERGKTDLEGDLEGFQCLFIYIYFKQIGFSSLLELKSEIMIEDAAHDHNHDDSWAV